MDQYFRYEAVRRRLHVGPLSSYLDAFARQLAEYGYAIDTGQQQLRVVSHLSQVDGPPEPASPRSQRAGPEALPRGSTTPGAPAEHRPEGIGPVPGALATDGRRGANAPALRRRHAGGPRARCRALSPPGARAGRGDDAQLPGGRAHVPHGALRRGGGVAYAGHAAAHPWPVCRHQPSGYNDRTGYDPAPFVTPEVARTARQSRPSKDLGSPVWQT